MTKTEIKRYIVEKFKVLDEIEAIHFIGFRNITEDEAEYYASRVIARGRTRRSTIKEYLLYCAGLTWKWEPSEALQAAWAADEARCNNL